MQQRILFLTLKVFSAMGGIEKVSRVAGKALVELGAEAGARVEVWSMYDQVGDVQERYIPGACFLGFGGQKITFVKECIYKGRSADLVILSHINLLTIGYAIKKLSPKVRLVLVAHGIEVWKPLPMWKRHMLQACDRILSVSRFTRDKMLQLHGLDGERLQVLNNCLDHFLPTIACKGKRKDLLARYGLTVENKLLLTLTRLSSAERYKGYDAVIMALKTLKREDPFYRYLIIGKYDHEEKERLDRLIVQQGLAGDVIFGGFVSEEELADHFALADIYVMPSRGEGFGIVFIEALYYGKPVIAGKIDGTVDALADGELGILIYPDRPNEIVEATSKVLQNKQDFIPDQTEVMKRFSFPVYKEQLKQILHFLLPVPGKPGERLSSLQRDERTKVNV
jgi:glycosyltransferase involved in cell wall biosynthesis